MHKLCRVHGREFPNWCCHKGFTTLKTNAANIQGHNHGPPAAAPGAHNELLKKLALLARQIPLRIEHGFNELLFMWPPASEPSIWIHTSGSSHKQLPRLGALEHLALGSRDIGFGDWGRCFWRTDSMSEICREECTTVTSIRLLLAFCALTLACRYLATAETPVVFGGTL